MTTKTHFYNGGSFEISLYQADPDELLVHFPGLLIVSQFADNDVLRRIDGGKLIRHKYRKGNITLVPQATRMWVKWSQPCQFIVVALHPEYSLPIANTPVSVAELSMQCHHSLRDPFLAQLCLALKNSLTEEARRSDQHVSSLVFVLGMHLAVHYAQKCTAPSRSFNQQTENRLNGAIEMIHNSLSDKITWQQVASSSKISPYHFSRLFKARTGLSPRQYIISARLNKAKSLLVETDYTVSEIAEVCGFSNASHLGSTFSKHLGMTPSLFRGR